MPDGIEIMEKYNCINCSILFVSNKGCATRTPKFCSKKCSAIYNCAKPDVREKMSVAKIGVVPYNKLIRYNSKCLECNKEIENRIGAKYIKKFCSMDCRNKNYTKRNYLHITGKNSHFYKHGNCNENTKERKSGKYKNWRISVFKRDNYTCVFCGQIGGKLNADHIKPFSIYKEFRYDLDNGRTLCLNCHYKTDTYGSKMLKYAEIKNI